MTATPKTREQCSRDESDRQMFGMTYDLLQESIRNALQLSGMTRPALAVSMLSDVQEQIALGRTEEARRAINRVKCLLSER
jgi:hypothetical protein